MKRFLDMDNKSLTIGSHVAWIDGYTMKAETGTVKEIGSIKGKNAIVTLTIVDNPYFVHCKSITEGKADLLIKMGKRDTKESIIKKLRKLRYKAITETVIKDGVICNTTYAERQYFNIETVYKIVVGFHDDNETITAEYRGFDKQNEEYIFCDLNNNRSFPVSVGTLLEAYEQ